jgi:KipI family sensor histidine kinase inhibitor
MLRGFYLPFSDTINRARNQEIHVLTRQLQSALLPGVTDLIPGYTNLYIEYDTAIVNETQVRQWLAGAASERSAEMTGRRVDIPVTYTGEDLAAVAKRCQMTVTEVITRHSQREYHVYALGFTPGYPFMGDLDDALRLPRRATPRPVPAHSVAIAGSQTGIYPAASPGGWHLLGHTSAVLFDPQRQSPFLLEAGDTVRFIPGEGAPPPDPKVLALLPAQPAHPLLEVTAPGLLDLVVDSGRFLAGRFGLARSGPVDGQSARLANRLLGNSCDAPVLELNVTGPTLQALDTGVVAFAGWGVIPRINGRQYPPFCSFTLHAGDTLSFTPIDRGYRGYLALPGGIDSATFWGSASVDLRGKIGRTLKAGDVLGAGRPRYTQPRAGFSFTPYRRFGNLTPLAILPGPQATKDALAALGDSIFTVISADRMGIRLKGAEVPGGDVISEATPLGAVQITSAGDPIILLNDRGTLGGYSKPALLHPNALSIAGQLKPGDRVRFLPESA